MRNATPVKQPKSAAKTTNARRVKTRIPESGRLGLGANGLNEADVLVAAFGNTGFSILLVVLTVELKEWRLI